MTCPISAAARARIGSLAIALITAVGCGHSEPSARRSPGAAQEGEAAPVTRGAAHEGEAAPVSRGAADLEQPASGRPGESGERVAPARESTGGFWGSMIAGRSSWRIPERAGEGSRYLRVAFGERRVVDGVTIVDLDWKIIDDDREISLNDDRGNRWEPSTLGVMGDRGSFFRYQSDDEIAAKVRAERPGPPGTKSLGSRYCSLYVREVKTERGPMYCRGEERSLEPDGPCFRAAFCFDGSGLVRVEGEVLPDGYGPFFRPGYRGSE